jgi:hypothetical protein
MVLAKQIEDTQTSGQSSTFLAGTGDYVKLLFCRPQTVALDSARII